MEWVRTIFSNLVYILRSVSSPVFGSRWGSGTRGTPQPTSTFSETLWYQSSRLLSPHIRKDMFWWDVRVYLFQSLGNPRWGSTNHLSNHMACTYWQCLCWVWESVFSRAHWIWIICPSSRLLEQPWHSVIETSWTQQRPWQYLKHQPPQQTYDRPKFGLTLWVPFLVIWRASDLFPYHVMCTYLLKQKIFFYTVSRSQIGHYFHKLQLLPITVL